MDSNVSFYGYFKTHGLARHSRQYQERNNSSRLNQQKALQFLHLAILTSMIIQEQPPLEGLAVKGVHSYSHAVHKSDVMTDKRN